MAVLGACIGPTLHGWYSTLGRILGETCSLPRNLGKVAVDQTLFAPVCIASFLSLTALLQGRDVVKTLENDYLDVLSANYKLWPPVQVSGHFHNPSRKINNFILLQFIPTIFL